MLTQQEICFLQETAGRIMELKGKGEENPAEYKAAAGNASGMFRNMENNRSGTLKEMQEYMDSLHDLACLHGEDRHVRLQFGLRYAERQLYRFFKDRGLGTLTELYIKEGCFCGKILPGMHLSKVDHEPEKEFLERKKAALQMSPFSYNKFSRICADGNSVREISDILSSVFGTCRYELCETGNTDREKQEFYTSVTFRARNLCLPVTEEKTKTINDCGVVYFVAKQAGKITEVLSLAGGGNGIQKHAERIALGCYYDICTTLGCNQEFTAAYQAVYCTNRAKNAETHAKIDEIGSRVSPEEMLATAKEAEDEVRKRMRKEGLLANLCFTKNGIQAELKADQIYGPMAIHKGTAEKWLVSRNDSMDAAISAAYAGEFIQDMKEYGCQIQSYRVEPDGDGILTEIFGKMEL